MSGSVLNLGPIPLLGSNSAPGNYLFESDLTQFATPPATTIGGICAGFQKGDLQPTNVSSPAQFVALYGLPNPAWSLAGYSALTFLKGSSGLLVRRVVNTDALAAVSYFVPTSGAVFQGVEGLQLAYTPYQDLNYAGGVPTVEVLATLPSFTSNAPSTAVVISYNINGGSTQTVSTTLGANVNQLLTNLNSVLNPLGISAFSGPVYQGNNSATQGLYFFGATESDFILISMVVASSTLTPITQGNYTDVLAVVAQNPGAWPNHAVGWTISNVDMGTPQQVTLTFNRQLLSGDSLLFEANVYLPGTTINLNEYNLSVTQAFVTSNDATLTALATLITNATVGGQTAFCAASAVLPDSTGNNGREIIITFSSTNLVGQSYATSTNINQANNGPLDYTTAQIIGTTSGATLSGFVAQSVVGIPSSHTFNFNVYTSANPNVPAEVFTGGFLTTVNGSGTTNNIVSLVNQDGSGSQYVRLVDTLPYSVHIFPKLFGNINSQINWLGGGADGSLPTNAQIAAAWNDFADSDNIDVDMLMNGGYATPIVQQAMDQVCQTRQDLCFAYLDVPSLQQSATGTSEITYRKNSLNLNSNRSGLYSPDILIQDPYTGANIYLPPSAYEAALQAITDNAVGPQQVAAGPNYGFINSALGLRYVYSKPTRGLLNSAQINAIKKLRSGGFAVYGAVTLQTVPSLLSYIPVRRIFSYIEQLVMSLLEGVDFDNISPTLELNVSQTVKGYLLTFINNGAIQAGTVITDSTVNTQVYANNGQFNVRVIVYPYSPAQFVVLDGVLSNNSAVFTESVVSS